jgi:putative transposase
MNSEYYHVYNRGAHKAAIFNQKIDYERFLSLLYIANNSEPVRFYNLNINKIFSYERKTTLVDIVAYCLMPNHFHIALKERVEGGITRFLQKLCTGYSMYYNIKYDHSGTIFQGRCKSKHVDNDDYFRYLIQYIHLNPFGIEEPDMTRGAKSDHLDEATAYSKTYEYSSFKDYLGEKRPQSNILATTSKVQPC